MGPIVFNLSTGQHFHYFTTATPREAILNAYALYGCRNGNSWEYEERYGRLIEETKRFLRLGDFCVAKDNHQFDRELVGDVVPVVDQAQWGD